MAVLDRTSLGQSPLADLHALASELGIDGYRRLRREELIEKLVEKQSGGRSSGTQSRSRSRSRSGGSSTRSAGGPNRREGSGDREPRSGGRDRSSSNEGREDEKTTPVEGTVELRRGGSAFLRLGTDGPTDKDPFISAAQVRRCELKDGDRVTGPSRPPRRSERYPSLTRIETINGKSADTVKPPAEARSASRSDSRRSASAKPRQKAEPVFPNEPFALAAGDSKLSDVQQLVPFGKGSRVTVTGGVGSGKSELLRRVAQVLNNDKGLSLQVVLAGVRPEELPLWQKTPIKLASRLTFEAKVSERESAVNTALTEAKKVFKAGGDAVVIVDGLTGLGDQTKQQLMAAARKLSTGGSLTVIAINDAAIGGETTFVSMNPGAVRGGSFPAIDMAYSNTVSAELLVGERGAKKIAKAISKASRKAR